MDASTLGAAIALMKKIPKGEDGVTPSISVGTTTTADAGSDAVVTRRSGSTDAEPIFDFSIPKGPKGDAGNGDMLAPAYADATANDANSYVTYNGGVYYLPNGHTANTTWANTVKVGPLTVGGEIIKVGYEMDFLAPKTINIFDPNNPYEVGYQSPSGTLDDATLVPSKDVDGTSAYALIMKAIPVVGGRTYAFPKSFVGRLSTYAAAVTYGYHSRSGYVSNTSMTSKDDCLQWTAPSNIGYIAMHIWNANGVTQDDVKNFMILEVANASTFTWPTSKIPYKRELGLNVPVSKILDYDIVGKDTDIYHKLATKVGSKIFNLYDNTVELSAGYTLSTTADIANLVPGTTAQSGYTTPLTLMKVPGGCTVCVSKDFYGYVGVFNPYGGRSVIYDQNALTYTGNCKKVTIPDSYDDYYIGISFSTAWYTDYEHFVLTVDVDTMPNDFVDHSTLFIDGSKILAENIVGMNAGEPESSFAYATDSFNEAYAARVQSKQGKNSLTISFKTDSHTDLGLHSLATDKSVLNAMQLGYVGDYLGQDLIVHGGDLLTYGYASKATPLHSLRTYLNRIYKFAKAPFLVAKGNHDDNCYDALLTTQNYSTDALIMPEEWNAIAMQYAKKYAVCPNNGRANYCYIDNERTKIRVFVLDSEDFDYHVTNSVAELNCGTVSAFSNDQLNFVAKALLFEDKEDPSEWAALFISHRPMDTTTTSGYRVGGGDALIRNVDVMLDIINAYKAGTACTESGYGGVNQSEVDSHYYPYDIDVDYTSKGAGEVICFLYGHTHDCNTSNQVGLNSSAKSYGHRYVGCGSASFYTLVIDRDTKKINVFFYDGVKANVELPKAGEIAGLTANDLDSYGDWETSWT